LEQGLEALGGNLDLIASRKKIWSGVEAVRVRYKFADDAGAYILDGHCGVRNRTAVFIGDEAGEGGAGDLGASWSGGKERQGESER